MIGAQSERLPPFVLTDISPSRGENGWVRELSHKKSRVLRIQPFGNARQCPESLSPLEGEMSGRTEGGEPLTRPLP